MSAKKLSVLRHVGTAIIPASAHYDPNASLVTRQGVYARDGFIDRVCKQAAAGPIGELTLPYGELEYDATIAKIVADSGREHTPLAACYAIDTMTRRQPNGELGDLANDGKANLFPIIGGPVVYVHWHSGRREWFVRDWLLDDYHWSRGYRAF